MTLHGTWEYIRHGITNNMKHDMVSRRHDPTQDMTHTVKDLTHLHEGAEQDVQCRGEIMGDDLTPAGCLE